MTLIPDLAHTARILIVDDDRHNRQVLEAMLGPEGYLLHTAAGGEEALAAIATLPPDLILLDVIMPGMDGNEVVRRIKCNSLTKNIPVIMVTALDDRSAKLGGLDAGAEDVLSKPVDRAELCARVRNLLRLKAYGDYYDKYSQMLEGEVGSRTADLIESERASASALQCEHDRAQRCLDTAAVILLALDAHGRITLVNGYACSLLGWTAAELMGRDWFETCLPLRIQGALKAKWPEFLAGEVPVFEHAILTKSGDERWIEWRNSVVRDNEGRVTGTFSSGTDITTRNLAAEALRIAEARMRFALESANVGIWDMDYTTGLLTWSETLEAQYGLQPGTFGGTFEEFTDLVHPDDRAPMLEVMGAAAASGSDFTTQNRSVAPDGQVRWLTGAGRIFLGAQGEPVRGIGISQNITERRTLELQYQQAQKMDAIGKLASGVAHDFNNLLTVILGFSGFVSSDVNLGERHLRDLGEITKAADRAAALTKQLLAFSRQQVLQTVPLDVNALITDMTGMLDRLIGEHIEITLALAPALSRALADRSQLEQVVMNLVVNARDAMPGGGRVTIETKDVDLENSTFHHEAVMQGLYVMVAVTDTGTGMTRETQRHLFEPFFTTKEPGKGTGLGLSTTYGIVKQSNGYIWVYSELGFGATFKVYLPCAALGVAEHAVDPVVAAPASRSSETVLVVEDEEGVRLLSKRILSSAGYCVLEAANGDDAEKVFAQHADSIDLVVTDVVMPGCGGPELLTRLQVHSPSLKVLYMSGYTEQAAAQRLGIDRGLPFVQKPFTAAEFMRQVRVALDRQSTGEPRLPASVKPGTGESM